MGGGGHRRAQSVSSGGVSWAVPAYPKAPLSPSAAAAAGGGAVVEDGSQAAVPPAAGAGAAAFSGSPAAAAAAAGRMPSTSNSSHSRLGDSLGGSSTAAAAAAPPAVAAAVGNSRGLPGLLQRGFLSGFSFWDWGSADNSVGLVPGGTAAERAAVERQYEVDEFVAATKRLVALYQRLHQVQDRWVGLQGVCLSPPPRGCGAAATALLAYCATLTLQSLSRSQLPLAVRLVPTHALTHLCRHERVWRKGQVPLAAASRSGPCRNTTPFTTSLTHTH